MKKLTSGEIRVAMTGMAGETTKAVDIKDLKLPKKPKRALVNARGDGQPDHGAAPGARRWH